jgi:hypothetical protein
MKHRFEARTAAASRAQVGRTVAAASLLLVGAALVLGTDAFACRDHDMAGADAKTHPQAASKAQPTAGTKQVAMSGHAANGEKGNGSGVTMTSSTAKSIPIGVATPVTLDFGAARFEGAVAQIRAPEGMQVMMADGSAVGDIALAVGQPTRVELLVTARDDGLQYLDVTTLQNKRASVRSIALAVGSGEAKLKSVGRVETMPNGERVKIMRGESR